MNFKYYKTERLILFIIGMSVVFGVFSIWLHHYIMKTPEAFKSLVIYTDSFTVPFFISITLFFVNNYWWKCNFWKWLVDIPDLNGRYTGKLISSFIVDGKPKTMDCVLEIKQSASSIHISGYFGDMVGNAVSSSSVSTSETITHEKSGFFSLYYVFTNETGDLSEKLNSHTGTAKFVYYPDVKRLSGGYYNKLKNIGTIDVTFEQAQLLNRLVK